MIVAAIGGGAFAHLMYSGLAGFASGWLVFHALHAFSQYAFLDNRWIDRAIGTVAVVVGLVATLAVLEWLERVR